MTEEKQIYELANKISKYITYLAQSPKVKKQEKELDRKYGRLTVEDLLTPMDV